MSNPPDIQALYEQLDGVERAARELVSDLDEARGAWRERPEAWSVAECLDHLAVTNRVYLAAMDDAARRARAQRRLRRRPALPGPIGRLFVRTLEPPVRPAMRVKTQRNIVPRSAPPLTDAFAQFLAAHDAIRAFMGANADLDLSGVRFANPLIRGIRFSLATGLHILPAHERRHLWQAWNARRGAEAAAAPPTGT